MVALYSSPMVPNGSPAREGPWIPFKLLWSLRWKSRFARWFGRAGGIGTWWSSSDVFWVVICSPLIMSVPIPRSPTLRRLHSSKFSEWYREAELETLAAPTSNSLWEPYGILVSKLYDIILRLTHGFRTWRNRTKTLSLKYNDQQSKIRTSLNTVQMTTGPVWGWVSVAS